MNKKGEGRIDMEEERRMNKEGEGRMKEGERKMDKEGEGRMERKGGEYK